MISPEELQAMRSRLIQAEHTSYARDSTGEWRKTHECRVCAIKPDMERLIAEVETLADLNAQLEDMNGIHATKIRELIAEVERLNAELNSKREAPL